MWLWKLRSVASHWPPKSPLIPHFGRSGSLHGLFQEGSRVFLVSAFQATFSFKGQFQRLAHLSPLRDLCLSLRSSPGATHGISDHDSFEDLTSPVILPVAPRLSPSPSEQPWTEKLPVLSWFCLRSGRTLRAGYVGSDSWRMTGFWGLTALPRCFLPSPITSSSVLEAVLISLKNSNLLCLLTFPHKIPYLKTTRPQLPLWKSSV